MVKLTNSDIEKICSEYNCGSSISKISSKYKIGDRRVRAILVDNGIEIYDSHKSKNGSTYVSDNLRRFPEHDGYVYKAVCKLDNTVIFDDYLNKSGTLTAYIKNTLNIDVPSLFLRKKFFDENGVQWYEQYFDIVEFVDQKKNTKKCPYCSWETVDVTNRSGMFLTHLNSNHNVTVEQYLKEYPEDCGYFSKQNKILEKKKLLENQKNYVLCPICNEKLEKITYWHIRDKHNMSYLKFKCLYPDSKLISDKMLEQTLSAQSMTNLTVSKNRFISSYERNLCQMLDNYDIKYDSNRQLLIGKEIDILVQDSRIGIEFDGLKWHTEWFGGKQHNYHLDKTILCNEKGYGLIHVFEDEYHNSKEIVESKIKHILKIDDGCKKIPARKCVINEIYKHDAEVFLNKYHIQGFASSTIYLGAFYEGDLIAVMTFKNGNLKNKCWELTRFAGNYNLILQGVGGKMFKYFVRKYNPYKIISFADRRWTVDIHNNLYTKIGFNIESINKPDYRYYNDKVDKFKRIHKMYFNKQKLHKKYGFPLTMTETEMAKELGYDRIWDCGLIKYVWTPE